MKFLILSFLLVLGDEAIAGSAASISLESAVSNDKQAGLIADSYLLPFEHAYVTQGSYSGIRMSFRTDKHTSGYHELILFIPSHENFSVGYDSSRGEYVSSIPKVPFTFNAERTTGIEDRRGRPRSLEMSFTYWKRSSRDSWSTNGVKFTDCDIEVKSMYIKEHELTFKGNFSCGSKQPGHNLSGSLSVDSGKLGVSKVD